MKLKKITTVFLTAVFMLTACTSALAAGSYADPVPVKMGKAISERLVKPEAPMYITCDSEEGDWSILVRGGYVKHATGEHVDYVAEYKGLIPWIAGELVRNGNHDVPGNWELLCVNGVPWQQFESPELDSRDEFKGINELGIGYTVAYKIKDYMTYPENKYSCVRQELPQQGKKMVSVYADRTAVALYESNKVTAEHLKARPFIKDGRMLVPLRGVVDYLGAEISWDQATKSVTISQPGKEIKFKPGDAIIYVNGQASTLDTPPIIVNDCTMIPLRFVSEQLGYTVKWMGDVKNDVMRADIYN